MSGPHDGGASGGFHAAHHALRELVMAATVRIHRTPVGYALDEPDTFLGSGFFIAPNWVLTCAHVVDGEEGGEVAVVYESAPGEGPSVVAGRVAATLPDHVHVGRRVRGGWPAPDLALVRLREPVGHDCVYVSERPTAQYGEGRVFYAGWTVTGGRLQMLDGFLSVQGTIGGWSSGVQMRLGQNDLPNGVSGGPVIDPVHGEVIGVLKSRADNGAGGTSTGIERLRTLQVPPGAVRTEHDDVYHAVFHAHDRYHRDRQQPSDSRRSTWADVQGELSARPGRALDPDKRAELLGRLAELPPPDTTRSLLDLLDSLPNFQAPSLIPAPRGWRDGLGLLNENARGGGALKLVLDYAMLVMAAERAGTPSNLAAEQALWDWVKQASTGLDSGYRSRLARQRARHLGQRRVRTYLDVGGTPEHARTGKGDAGARLSVLLEVLPRGWEPDRCDWSISVARADGEVTRLHEAERTPLDELSSHVVGPLTEAFRRCDEPDRPVALHAALPHRLLGLAVDEWESRAGGPPLGAQRPVVVRCSDRDQVPGDDAARAAGTHAYPAEDGDEERRDRWNRLHARDALAEVLDCDDGVREPVPAVAELRGLAPRTVPVLCRFGDERYEDDAAALGRIVHAGFGVVLWRRWRSQPEVVCGEFHRGAKKAVDDGDGAARLPDLVHGLRVKVREGLTEAFWADGIALLYDDPHQPLPGTGDLLEAP
ncbi:VMAP-C domain-containing protein [Streptomyces brasiliensis]|uniref:Serine protease n=1 Tax=Streptomyces brasiliensis TaxID=1954 RepID=A0A917NM92_9ACTN|nr:trypsin-like peptidase domain-containing protein [Streptomyces brasiliensis]GGJ11400.1 serine protease [Streptomyces brasiliensis]